MNSKYLVSVFLLFIIGFKSLAQDFGLKISPDDFSIEENVYKGYATKLNYPFPLIKKEWWRYIKKIAHLENRKTHYIITFPANKNESNSDLSFVSITEDNDTYTTIRSALVNQELNSQFQKYTKNLLLGFKVKFFTSIVQKQIDKSEKEALRISREIDVLKKKIISAEYKKERGKGNRTALSKDILLYRASQDSLSVELQGIQTKITHNKEQLKKIK